MIAESTLGDLIFAFPMVHIYKPIMEKTRHYREPVFFLEYFTYG